MGQVSSILRRTTEGYMFWCPGCEETHHVRTDGPQAVWSFNGNVEAPTFTPSVLMRSGHFLTDHRPGSKCWCTYAQEHPERPVHFKCRQCHSFVTDGQIQFLGDCSHGMAGTTVDIPELPVELRDEKV